MQVKEVKALIGFFDLDPNRVYDVVLDAFELSPDDESLLALIPLFSGEARTQILGFKFQRLVADGAPVPEALFRVAARMIKVCSVVLQPTRAIMEYVESWLHRNLPEMILPCLQGWWSTIIQMRCV